VHRSRCVCCPPLPALQRRCWSEPNAPGQSLDQVASTRSRPRGSVRRITDFCPSIIKPLASPQHSPAILGRDCTADERCPVCWSSTSGFTQVRDRIGASAREVFDRQLTAMAGGKRDIGACPFGDLPAVPS
jgi:hypothetical protein